MVIDGSCSGANKTRQPVRQRADRLLVARGLFEGCTKAQAAIAAGLVTANGAPVAKPAEEIPLDPRGIVVKVFEALGKDAAAETVKLA